MQRLTEQQVNVKCNNHNIHARFAIINIIVISIGVIERFDLTKCEWSTVERYPQDIWEHVCATLFIPRCREDMEVISDLPKT